MFFRTSFLSIPSKREEEKKRNILTNPVKMKEIRKMVRERKKTLPTTPKGSAVNRRPAFYVVAWKFREGQKEEKEEGQEGKERR